MIKYYIRQMKSSILFIAILLLSVSLEGQDQDRISFDVRRISGSPIVEADLQQAHTIKDINPGYPSSWVDGYESVVVTVTDDEQTATAMGQGETFTAEQQALLKDAIAGDQISIEVKYRPAHFSKHEASKTIAMNYSIVPEKEAEYPGGRDALMTFLEERTIGKLNPEIAKAIEIASVTFTISGDGIVEEVTLDKPTYHASVNELLLNAFKDMPKWAPATRADGSQLSQKFQLTLGTMIGC